MSIDSLDISCFKNKHHLLSNKKTIIQLMGLSPNDTGSYEVQCTLFTIEIAYLSNHILNHKKDFSAKNRLIFLVQKRRKFLKKLKSDSNERYLNLIKLLKLKDNI